MSDRGNIHFQFQGLIRHWLDVCALLEAATDQQLKQKNLFYSSSDGVPDKKNDGVCLPVRSTADKTPVNKISFLWTYNVVLSNTPPDSKAGPRWSY